jgi:hypothetical protein
MKLSKKISVAYTLQIFAVIFLFGYAISSPGNETQEIKNNDGLPQDFNKQLFLKANQDSLLNKKINDPKRYMVKQ